MVLFYKYFNHLLLFGVLFLVIHICTTLADDPDSNDFGILQTAKLSEELKEQRSIQFSFDPIGEIIREYETALHEIRLYPWKDNRDFIAELYLVFDDIKNQLIVSNSSANKALYHLCYVPKLEDMYAKLRLNDGGGSKSDAELDKDLEQIVERLKTIGSWLYRYGVYQPVPDLGLQPLQDMAIPLKQMWFNRYCADVTYLSAVAISSNMTLKEFAPLVCQSNNTFPVETYKDIVDDMFTITFWYHEAVSQDRNNRVRSIQGDALYGIADIMNSTAGLPEVQSLLCTELNNELADREEAAIANKKPDLRWYVGDAYTRRWYNYLKALAGSPDACKKLGGYLKKSADETKDFLNIIGDVINYITRSWKGRTSFAKEVRKLCASAILNI